jgi:aspartate kinase
MAIIIKKYGGTSVESIQKLQRIAQHIATEKNETDQIVIVVSAMGKTTDQLFAQAYEITKNPDQREMDMLVTAGERITMALLSLTLQQEGISSKSFTGSQSGIVTDSSHGNAKILSVNAFRISDELDAGKVVIVAGFQGVSLEKEVTTLGRGGSDTTAVALACFLGAKKCEIFTDVDGVYTADPRLVGDAKKLPALSYEQMLYLAYTGAKVLHSRAVEFAQKYKIITEIKSSSTYTEGTMITELENTQIKAISHKENLLLYHIDLIGPDMPIFTTEIFDIQVAGIHLAVWVENRYESNFVNELILHKLHFVKNENTFATINLMGYRICKDISFLSQIYTYLAEKCQDTFSIKNNGIGVEIIIKQEEVTEILQYFHEKYIVGEK